MLPAMIARILALVLIALAATTANALAQESRTVRAQVVVELFTSQGCSQCPRANRLLGMFAAEEDALALTFPVGIWDYLGWHDTFAEPENADRQRAYSQAMRVRGRFTPQLVINGSRQISASDWDQVRATYDAARAERLPANAPELSIRRMRNNIARITVGARANAPPSELWLVVYDPGPISVQVTRGININRTVTHFNLVRRIERIDAWNGASAWYNRSRCTPQCAVLLQETSGGRVIAASFTVPENR